MNTVVILGSPRKRGNSATIAHLLAEELARQGSHVSTFYLNDLNYHGCQACRACKTVSESCVLEDDLSGVFAELHRADILILATPVYWGDVSAQLKGFIDRLYALLTPGFMTEAVKHRLAPGKQLIFVITQAAGLDRYDDVFPRYNAFFEQLGLFSATHLIRGCDLDETSRPAARADLTAAARQTVMDVLAAVRPPGA